MGEAEVELIARKTVDAYDEKVGAPRHTENVHNFGLLFAALNKLKGAVWAFGTISSLLLLCCAAVGAIDVVLRWKGAR